MKKILSIILLLASILSLAACGTASTSAQSGATKSASTAAQAEGSDAIQNAKTLKDATVKIFIAASLENAFKDIIGLYNDAHPNVTINYDADSSGTLLTQIEEGFACDIYFSAAVKQMTTLEDDGLVLKGTRVDLLKNQLVLITQKDSGTKVTGLDNIGKASSIALADGSVPVGKYTRVALQKLGVLEDSLDPAEITTEQVSKALGGVQINETSNVAKTLTAVAEGSNEVGTVYYSDAYSEMDNIKIIQKISTDLTGNIIYPMARVTNKEADAAETAAADNFYQFLQSDKVMQIFEQYKFQSNVS